MLARRSGLPVGKPKMRVQLRQSSLIEDPAMFRRFARASQQ